MTTEKKFNILIKAKELLQYTVAISSKKCMKAFRFTICDYMVKMAMDILKYIAIANGMQRGDEERCKLQNRIIVICDVFNIYIEILNSVQAINPHTMAVWGKKCTDVKYMVCAWRKKERT